MSLKLFPPSLLSCHCTAGVGVPLAAASKIASSPALTISFGGLTVTTGEPAANTNAAPTKLSPDAPTSSVFPCAANANELPWKACEDSGKPTNLGPAGIHRPP